MLIKTLLLGTIAVLAHAQAPLTNADVVKMASQGISQASMIEAIKSARAVSFQVAPPDQPALESAGVPRPVVMEMVRRIMRDEARSNVRSGSTMEGSARVAPVVSPRSPRISRTRSIGGWGLEPGRPELLFRGGGVAYIVDGATTYSWSMGFGAAVGVSRYVAISGEYNYNHIGGASITGFSNGVPFSASGSDRLHDIISGVRISGPWKASPYLFGGGGLASYVTSGDASLLGSYASVSRSFTKPAVAMGGGLNTSITPRFGILLDARAIRPIELPWYVRITGGLYVRF
jgi:hypothetical protein